MGTTYIVKQGDYLAKIAQKNGYHNWRTIYNHKDNTSFRQKRPNPNILLAGDKLILPDKILKEVSCQTEKRHTFRLKTEKIKLKIVLKDMAGKGISYKKYLLETSTKTYERTQAEDLFLARKGIVEETLSLEEDNLKLKVWLDEMESDEQNNDDQPHFEWEIKLGDLDPLEEISGIKARLNNLGFTCGEVDNNKDEHLTKAIENFQTWHSIKPSGKLDLPTQKKIAEQHGS
ncbi:MAG: peptidoglycan-binding protein [Deltaproteobacteria bacterium]|nr:peptidoglycan-binding protein [Deltaproteobacteria bacterium]